MAIVLPKFSRRRSPSGLANEAQPALNVALCREDGRYQAGGVLRATYRVSRVPADRLDRIEVSVLWSTDGKGDEDMHVQHFQSIDRQDLITLDPSKPQKLECKLPATPLSYHGRLVSVCWCLRVRLFMDDGKEIVTEQPFHLVSAIDPADPDGRKSRRSIVRSNTTISADEVGIDTVAPSTSGEDTVVSSPDASTEPAPVAVAEDSNRRILFGRLTGSRRWRSFMDGR